MNAFNPLVFAASFTDFILDVDGEVTIEKGMVDKATFSLRYRFDDEITITATIALKPKQSAYWVQPAHSIDPDDEIEVGYWGYEVDTVTCAYVTSTLGVTASQRMPFVLTNEQVKQLCDALDDIALRQFEKEINSFEPDYEECF